MKTTSRDNANLAEIADLLTDIERTNKELKSPAYGDSSPSISWIPFLALALIAASFGLFAGATLYGGLF